jgi:hypothetical protein
MNYYFILATQKFLFEKEPLEEVLREKNQYYKKNNKVVDFWIVPEPKFLESNEDQIKQLKEKFSSPVVSIISTDKTFITWLKLRYQNVVSGQFNAPSFSIKNPLEYNLGNSF